MTLAEKKNRLREYRLLKHEISALELELSSIDDMFAVHRRNLFDKLGTDSITEAVAFATNYGLL